MSSVKIGDYVMWRNRKGWHLGYVARVTENVISGPGYSRMFTNYVRTWRIASPLEKLLFDAEKL
jgi:hypothetical protein